MTATHQIRWTVLHEGRVYLASVEAGPPCTWEEAVEAVTASHQRGGKRAFLGAGRTIVVERQANWPARSPHVTDAAHQKALDNFPAGQRARPPLRGYGGGQENGLAGKVGRLAYPGPGQVLDWDALRPQGDADWPGAASVRRWHGDLLRDQPHNRRAEAFARFDERVKHATAELMCDLGHLMEAQP